MRRPRTFGVLLAVMALVGTACGATVSQQPGSSLPEPFASGKVRIALVRQLGSGDFFEQWLTGAQKMAKALNVTLLVSDARGNNAQQARNLDTAINEKVDAIIVDHGFAETMNAPIDDAVRKGIPVVVFDVEVKNPSIPQIQQSDIKLGRTIAEKMVKDLNGRGKVGYVYVAGFAPLDRRDQAWRQVKSENPGIEQVAQFGKVSDSTASDVAAQADAVLRAHPDLNAILAPFDEFAKGAVLSIQRSGMGDKVKVYGVDISTADIGIMTAAGSPWVATAATDPANVGAVAVRAAALRVKKEQVQTQLLIPPTLITREFLIQNNIHTMADLRAKLPDLNTTDLATAAWMPKIQY